MSSSITAAKITRALVIASPPLSEPEILQRLGGTPVQARCPGVVPPTRSQIALGDPHSRTMTRRFESFERVLRLVESRFCLVETPLLEQRTTEHELSVADFVESILTATHERERVTRL